MISSSFLLYKDLYLEMGFLMCGLRVGPAIFLPLFTLGHIFLVTRDGPKQGGCSTRVARSLVVVFILSRNSNSKSGDVSLNDTMANSLTSED